mmetsp:Transcript_22607/g.36970  ORF Transcript_22607/g.36970 Transcript_22607/m.36970 type:complete len:101 (-) Transcript_22607:6338-6640(-)
MTRYALTLVAAMLASPALAIENLEEKCGYQAQVVAAIQQARLDRVAERDVPEHLLAASPEWPENYNATIPLITPWVYEQKRRIIRNEDLSAVWNELCLQQ